MQVQFTASCLKVDYKKMEFDAQQGQKASTYESYTFYFDNPDGFADSDKIIPLSMSKKVFDERGLKDSDIDSLRGVQLRVLADVSPSKYAGAFKVRLMGVQPLKQG